MIQHQQHLEPEVRLVLRKQAASVGREGAAASDANQRGEEPCVKPSGETQMWVTQEGLASAGAKFKINSS